MTVSQCTTNTTQPCSWSLAVSYLGNKTLHLPLSYDLNAPLNAASVCVQFTAGCTTNNISQRRFLVQTVGAAAPQNAAGIGVLDFADDSGYSNYNALLASIKHRFSHGFNLQANYTYSHCMSIGDFNGDLRGTYYMIQNNPRFDYGNCNFDIRHIFNASLVAASPFRGHGPAKWLLGGWQFAPSIRATTGFPLNITLGTDSLATFEGNDRPEYVPGQPLYINKWQTCGANQCFQVFNAAAFANPTAPNAPSPLVAKNGNVYPYPAIARDWLRAPGVFNFDASASRLFPIRERFQFEFRFDAFNVLNHFNPCLVIQAPRKHSTPPISDASQAPRWPVSCPVSGTRGCCSLRPNYTGSIKRALQLRGDQRYRARLIFSLQVMTSSRNELRIVSLAPSATSILCAIGAKKALVGVTKWCADVAEVAGLPHLGDCWRMEAVEEILALRPTLVIGSVPYKQETVAKLLERPLNFLAMNPRTLADVDDDIRLLGRITGRVSSGERVIRGMQAALAKIQKQAHPRRRARVYCEAWPHPRISSPPWVAELVKIAGGEMVLPPGERVSDEQVATAAPEVIVLAWAATGSKADPNKAYQVEAWKNVPAIRKRRVHVISDELLNTPGPPLADGARAIFRILDRFSEEK